MPITTYDGEPGGRKGIEIKLNKKSLIGLGIAALATVLATSNTARQKITQEPVHFANYIGDSIVYGTDKYSLKQYTPNGYQLFLDLAHRDPNLASFIKDINRIPQDVQVATPDSPIIVPVLDDKGKTIHQWYDELKPN